MTCRERPTRHARRLSREKSAAGKRPAFRLPSFVFLSCLLSRYTRGMTAQIGAGGRHDVAPLDEAQREAVLAYCRIAAGSGALLSLKDLVELLSVDATEEELGESIASDEWLAPRVLVESGQVVLKSTGSDLGAARKAIEEAEERRRRAVANIDSARAFARLFAKDAIFVAVAGTNSYLFAAEGDDIDYYCITKTDGMWRFMLKALVLADFLDCEERRPALLLQLRDGRETVEGRRQQAEDRRPRSGHAHGEGDLRLCHLPRDS